MTYPYPHIVRADCIHCGACEEISPRVFQVNKALGFALVLNPRGASPLIIQEAMDNCPVHCIQWKVGAI
jgi:ferredoxin